MLLVVVGVVTKSAMVSTKLPAKDGVKSFIQTLLSAGGCCGEGKGWKGDLVRPEAEPGGFVLASVSKTLMVFLASGGLQSFGKWGEARGDSFSESP